MKELNTIDIAFDHKEIIDVALKRIRGKIEYTDLAFSLLKNKNRFTIYELRKIYEAILDKELDRANFRRMFKYKYIEEGKVEITGEKCRDFANPSDYYRIVLNDSITSVVIKD